MGHCGAVRKTTREITLRGDCIRIRVFAERIIFNMYMRIIMLLHGPTQNRPIREIVAIFLEHFAKRTSRSCNIHEMAKRQRRSCSTSTRDGQISVLIVNGRMRLSNAADA